MRPPIVRCTLAAAIVVLLVVHAITWAPSQLLWGCHIASALLAIGLVTDQPRLLAVPVLFHAGIGIPAYLFELATTDVATTASSILLHTLPAAAGAWALWGRPLPRGTFALAWLVFPVASGAAYVLADPALNVNLVHAPFSATASWFPTVWSSWFVSAGTALACLAVARAVLQLVWPRR